jgi:hypothetical protein
MSQSLPRTHREEVDPKSEGGPAGRLNLNTNGYLRGPRAKIHPTTVDGHPAHVAAAAAVAAVIVSIIVGNAVTILEAHVTLFLRHENIIF